MPQWEHRSMMLPLPRGDICIGRVVGALLECGRRLSLPSPRWEPSPLPAPSRSTLKQRTRRPLSDECANAPPLWLSRDFAASYSGAALLVRRSPCFSYAAGSPRFPSRRSSRFRWSRSLRHATHASPPSGEYEPVERRGRSRFAGIYAHASTKKKFVRPERGGTNQIFEMFSSYALTICEDMPL